MANEPHMINHTSFFFAVVFLCKYTISRTIMIIEGYDAIR